MKYQELTDPRKSKPTRDSRSSEGRSKSYSQFQKTIKPESTELYFLTAWGNNNNLQFPGPREKGSWHCLGHGILTLSLGEKHSIIINNKNQTYAIGSNQFGQLALEQPKVQKPVIIPQLRQHKVITVACGAYHTILLTNKNELLAFGLNITGQLGLGHFSNQRKPAQVQFYERRQKSNFFDSSLQNQKSVSFLDPDQYIANVQCGALHSLILTNKGRVLAAGHGENYALGNNDRTNQPFFKEVTMQFDKIEAIFCGLSHSGAITGGKALLWGTIGQKIVYKAPTLVELGMQSSCQIYINDMRLGDSFTIFLTSEGEVYHMGQQLRDDQSSVNFTPKKVAGLQRIVQIECGKSFCFAVNQSRMVFGWGNNKFGQVTANFKTYGSYISQPVLIKNMFQNSQPHKLFCGSYHSMMLSSKQSISERQLEDKQNLPQKNDIQKKMNESEALKVMNFQLLQKIQKMKTQLPKKKAMQNVRIQTDREPFEQRSRSPSLIKKNSKFQITGTQKHRTFNNNLEIDFSQLVLQKQISQGGYGIIYRAKWRESTVAVKMFKIENNDSAVRDFLSQCHAMQALRHPNIVMFLGACTKPPKLCIVLQFCSRGSLWSTLQNQDLALSWEDKKRFAMDTAKGVHYLHSCQPPILHRDLKSLNLLLDDSFRVKLADFGWTKSLANYMTGKIGTYQWMAPEVIAGQQYTEKADVFSYGIILWQIAAREPPYRNISGMQVSFQVLNNDLRPQIPKKTPEPFSRLIKRCWERDPEKRPSFKQIIKELQFMRIKQ